MKPELAPDILLDQVKMRISNLVQIASSEMNETDLEDASEFFYQLGVSFSNAAEAVHRADFMRKLDDKCRD